MASLCRRFAVSAVRRNLSYSAARSCKGKLKVCMVPRAPEDTPFLQNLVLHPMLLLLSALGLRNVRVYLRVCRRAWN